MNFHDKVSMNAEMQQGDVPKIEEQEEREFVLMLVILNSMLVIIFFLLLHMHVILYARAQKLQDKEKLMVIMRRLICWMCSIIWNAFVYPRTCI